MASIITHLRNNIHRQIKSRSQRVRCISVRDIRDTDEIEIEMINQNVIIIFFKEFRIQKSLDAKRFLQCLNALIRKYNFEILNMGNLDYLLLLPSSFEISTDSLRL